MLMGFAGKGSCMAEARALMAASTLLPPSVAGFGSALSAAAAVAAKAKNTQHWANAISVFMVFS
jgi:hypothetical protein